MGNYPSPYSNTKRIQEILQKHSWGREDCVEVNLNEQEYKNPFQHKYIIKLDKNVAPNCNIAMIFPTNPHPKHVILYLTEYTTSGLNVLWKTINDRIKESVSMDQLHFIVSCGDRLYKFRGFTGTIYILWAERINLQTINIGQENDIAEYAPILVEMNGQMDFRNIFLLSEGKLLNRKDVDIIEPGDFDMWSCDTDPRQDNIKVVPTISNEMADQITRDRVVRSLIRLEKKDTPFSSTTEDDVLALVQSSSRIMGFNIENPGRPDEE
jgi:hypothetical protein